MNRMNN